MKASELIKILQEKIDNYWDEEILIKDYRANSIFEIEWIYHKGEDWIFITVNK